MRTGMTVCAVVVLLLLGGCMKSVKPWQRGDLARPEMAFDADPQASAQQDHTYVSKEAASGGPTLGGGGCGCN
ncbi:MAG TPA: DUF4266 domain-containing protein [Stenotrophobium sp.]|nr:DUF4266 domain-containing protein [Stenotrophobium sp.]